VQSFLCNFIVLFKAKSFFEFNIAYTSKMFSIVVFLGPVEQVGTIPTKWLNSSNTSCKWPSKDFDKAIRKNKDPEEDWTEYPVRVISKHPICKHFQICLQ